jgi:hypothetical protein
MLVLTIAGRAAAGRVALAFAAQLAGLLGALIAFKGDRLL